MCARILGAGRQIGLSVWVSTTRPHPRTSRAHRAGKNITFEETLSNITLIRRGRKNRQSVTDTRVGTRHCGHARNATPARDEIRQHFREAAGHTVPRGAMLSTAVPRWSRGAGTEQQLSLPAPVSTPCVVCACRASTCRGAGGL